MEERDRSYEQFYKRKTHDFLDRFQKKFKKSALFDYNCNPILFDDYTGFSLSFQIPADEFNDGFLKNLKDVIQESRLNQGTLDKRVVLYEENSGNDNIKEVRISVFYKPRIIRTLARNLSVNGDGFNLDNLDIDRVLKILSEDPW